MKKTGKRILAALLSSLMILEMAQLSLASAAEAVDRALNPAEQIELSVPEELQDAGNCFFLLVPACCAIIVDFFAVKEKILCRILVNQ